MMSSEYTLYDNGKSPNKYKYKKHHAKYGLRRELAGITYVNIQRKSSIIISLILFLFQKNKLFESKSVRELNAIIPKIGCDIQPAQVCDWMLMIDLFGIYFRTRVLFSIDGEMYNLMTYLDCEILHQNISKVKEIKSYIFSFYLEFVYRGKISYASIP